MAWHAMDYTENDIDRLMRENQRELRDLADAAQSLREVVGRGESRSGLTKAVVDADGRLQSVTFAPRVLRLDVAALQDEVVQAVRQAQEDQDRQTRGVLGVPEAQLGLEDIQRQFEEFRDLFAAETSERNLRMRRLAERDPYDD
ncbi:YbaB/EbfC family nucleoid-associated protein [[Actinomadura] parvosata]